MKLGWLLAAALPFIAALLFALLGCSLPRYATPGGLEVVRDRNEVTLSPAKQHELDARHKALLECLPPESLCTTEPPLIAIDTGGDCDRFEAWGERHRELYYPNNEHKLVLPPSLGAAAHGMTHHYTCTSEPADPKRYQFTWLRKCGDEVDKFFRRLYPPTDCEEA